MFRFIKPIEVRIIQASLYCCLCIFIRNYPFPLYWKCNLETGFEKRPRPNVLYDLDDIYVILKTFTMENFPHTKNWEKISFLYWVDTGSVEWTFLDRAYETIFWPWLLVIIDDATITLLKMGDFRYFRGWGIYGLLKDGGNLSKS